MTDKFSKVNLAQLAEQRRALDKLEPVIHSRARLGIVSLLATHESLTFTELRDALDLTDGNLAAHLRALDAAGFLSLRKVGRATKPITVIALSKGGRSSFVEYLDALEQIVKRHR